MDHASMATYLDREWESSILPVLESYIAIPCLSPDFDPDWSKHGFIDQAMERLIGWCRNQNIASPELIRLPGRTPLLLLDVAPHGKPGDSARSALLYGHMDKQPEMTGWRSDLGPWKPVREGDRLYGRGGGDDGYSVFAAVSAIAALRHHGISHGRCLILIEASEESGSPDLPAYIEHLSERIGDLGLVVCLDSGAGTYDRLWTTSSLRGVGGGVLTVEVMREGRHSGAASGIVPSSFRIARQLVERLEDASSGAVRLRSLYVDIPAERIAQTRAAAAVLGASVADSFPFAGGTRAVHSDVTELLLNHTWRPQLEVIGAAGLPALDSAGNVLRPHTALKLSLRLPPTGDAVAAAAALQTLLTADPPYGAQVTFTPEQSARGWNAPSLAPWLEESLARASRNCFGREVCYHGEGGTIPFRRM
jgi:acetylornithine deacetylase/succinyl-diaminopimelate desuccinylase-like protein